MSLTINDEKIKFKKLQYGLEKAQALANIGHWELDLVENTLYWSDEVYRIFGLKPQEFGATYEAFLEHIHPDDIDYVNKSYMDSVNEKRGYHITHRIIRKCGEIGFVEERCEHEFDVNGEVVLSIGTVHDITKQKVIHNELVLASAVFEKLGEGVLITDSNKIIVNVNEAFCKISGYSADEMIGNSPDSLSSGWHDKSFYTGMWKDINSKGQWHGEILDRKKSGEVYTAEFRIIAIHDKSGRLTNYISITNDITRRKEQEKLIHNLAYYDSLTELPNKVLFEERVKSRIPSAKRNNRKMALLFIDMDNFKKINDTFGHLLGDKFLVEVSKEFKKIIREQDTLSRLGGDDFLILLEDIETITDIMPIVERIVERFNNPLTIDSHKLYSGVSVGISVYPDDGTSYTELIKAADIAMYQVKESGKKGYKFYTESMNEKIMERLQIESNLRSAIEKGEFFLEYQPKVNLETKSVFGMEALIRWSHPELGLVQPDKFISVSEETGQIYELGLWVVKKAVMDTKYLHDLGHNLCVSVNVSNKQLENENFIYDICSIVDEIGLDKSFIELEITESHIMNDIDKSMLMLQELYDKGFKMSIDDFGTGYSSLSYLKKLPIHVIKIDRSFVLDIDKDEDDKAIVATVIAMARSLGKDVIAEGSETKGHIEALQYLHCNKIQGFYFSKPLILNKFKEFVENFKM